MHLPDPKKFPLNINDNLEDLIQEFGLEIVNIESINGYEIRDCILYIWGFNETSEDKQICELLKQNPNTDTLFIGKGVTDKNDLKKIHYVLLSSHNVIPIIKNIIVEDESRFYSVDGLLIDKKSMTVKDYASGRDNDIIVIPNGIVRLDEHCFNYNEYVKHLILPASTKEIDGIISLPKLVDVNIDNNIEFYSKNGILFSAATKAPFFIPPYNSLYPNSDELKAMFSKIYYWVKSEAENKRWHGVTPNNFSIDPYDKNDIYISYNGGYYRQYWRIYRQPLPTRIVFEYSFYEEWDVECAARQIEESDIYEETTLVQLKCNECVFNNICDDIYKSNDIYMSNTINRLNASRIAHFKTMGKTNFNCELTMDSPIETIFQTLLLFLDIAMEYRSKYPIKHIPTQSLLFTDYAAGYNHLKDSPFDISSSSLPLDFISEHDNGQDDSEPPF